MSTQELALQKPTGGAIIARQDFGGTEVTSYSETAARAVAAREQAAVQARYVMAMQYPRKMHDFRDRILAECSRPDFAAVARYVKPIGKDKAKWPKGPSIRFVEAALRAFRNVAPEVMTVFESDGLRVVRVTVTDLEANITYSNEIQIEKTVERKGYNGQPPEGRDILAERTNSYGDKVYIVRATEDEVMIKQAALVSKAIRTQGLRLLPGDVVEECMAKVVAVQQDQDAEDPNAALKRLMDSFSAFGVKPSDLEAYVGKQLERLTTEDKQDLRAVFASIRDGETSWDEVMAERNPTGSQEAADEVAKKRIAALQMRRGAAAGQSGSTPEASSTVGGVESANGPEGSGEQASQEGQPEETPTQTPKQSRFNLGRKGGN